jgi:hypothetical protein
MEIIYTRNQTQSNLKDNGLDLRMQLYSSKLHQNLLYKANLGMAS